MIITEEISKDRPSFTNDLAIVDRNTKAITISDKTINLSFLSEFNFEKVWLVCLNQKTFEKVVSQLSPVYLNLYGCRVKDLSLLETLPELETVVKVWNTKAVDFWDFRKNPKLKTLCLGDITKIHSLEKLSLATSLEKLKITGSMNSTWKCDTLQPLANLTKLKSLTLAAINVVDKSLQPLAALTNLEILEVTNQFPTAEFARLSTKLKNTTCQKFQPYTKVSLKDMDGNVYSDIMITGSRKPFLHSKRDAEKIEKYAQKFQKLVADFEKEAHA